ncbi:MAG: CpaF family protein [Deltaproteobacteria bacterium]
MDRFEKVHLILGEVRKRVLPRIQRQLNRLEADDVGVRRLIEATLGDVMRADFDGEIDDSLRCFLIEEAINEIFGFGPIDRYIKDPDVWEVMVNGPKEVYVEREGRLEKTQASFQDEKQLRYYIERLLSPSGRHVSEYEPFVDARFPDGSRINVVRNPIAPFGPLVTIRKANRKIMSVHDLLERKVFDQDVAHFLRACVRNHLNIVLAGGPGAGKTTLLNVLGSYIPETERVVTIEDTLELRLEFKHRVAMESRPANIEGKGEIRIRELLRNALHMRPDRIIIGEVRGEEALDMLQSMNIGRVGSMTTLHANSALDALLRLETMAMMAGSSVPAELMRRQIVSAIDLVICLDRLPDGTRCVRSISEVLKENPATYATRDIYAAARRPGDGEIHYDLKATGYRPVFLDKFVDLADVPAAFR